MRKAWFRHKSIGWGLAPASWEGWLCVLGLITVVTATMVLLGDPSPAKPGAVESVMRLRADMGLTNLRLPYVTRFALVGAEVLIFALFARTRTAPNRPLD